jgi:hypothetical protein
MSHLRSGFAHPTLPQGYLDVLDLRGIFYERVPTRLMLLGFPLLVLTHRLGGFFCCCVRQRLA